MERDYRAEPVPGMPKLSHFGPDHAHQHAHSHAYQSAQPAGKQRDEGDVCSILGLPSHAVTPAVMQAVIRLLSELDRLRQLNDQLDYRQNWLEHQADMHSVLSCLNRRAFLRLLQAYLVGPDATGLLLTLHVDGVEGISRQHGLAAADAALLHIHSRLGGLLRGTDLLACLSGADFAILLPGTELPHGRKKLSELIAAMTWPGFVWQGRPLELTPSGGIHILVPGQSAEAALESADANRRYDNTRPP